MLSPKELHRRGLDKSNSGRYADARRLFERALRQVEEPDLEARIRLSLGYVEFELGSAEAGLALCRSALDLERVTDDARGLVHSQLGLLLLRSGQNPAALEAFATAISMLGSDPEPMATAHLNRGFLYLLQGDYAEASTDLAAAIDYARQAGLPLVVAKAEHNLGYARLLAGDIAAALRLMDRARPAWAGESATYQALCEQDRAEVLRAAGLVSDASTVLQETIRVYGRARLRQYQAEAQLTLARMLLVIDPAAARGWARRAGRRFRQRNSTVWALRADAVAMSAEVALGRVDPGRLYEIDELSASLRSHGMSRDATDVALRGAQAAAATQALDEATSRLASVRIGADAPLQTRIMARQVRADVAARRGRRTQALRHIRSGLAELHEWQSAFGSLDLQSSMVGLGRDLALRGMSVALSSGRPDVVFEWAERARALAGRVQPVRPPADDATAADLAELRRLHTEIAAASSQDGVPASLRRREAALRAQIRQVRWHDKGSGLVTEPEPLDYVQQRLGADEVVVNILAVDDRLTALVVSEDVAEVVPLGPLAQVRQLLDGMQADLDMAAAHLPAAIRQSVHAGLGQRLVQLSSQLVAPWSRHVQDRRVVVVPSGALAGTPWTLLPDLAGLPVTVPRSASEWIRARGTAGPASKAGFVAGPRVDRAHEEIKRAAYAWPAARLLEGADVQAEAVRALASEVDVFHVAAHGRHSADNPLFSGLELVDGPWFGYDIDQVRSIPSAVILSACELGRSTVRWGEESIGMTAAWLHAGARCVIASPALVDDDVACEVLSATHQQLAQGVQPANALASAMAEVAGGVAPFICFGSGW